MIFIKNNYNALASEEDYEHLKNCLEQGQLVPRKPYIPIQCYKIFQDDGVYIGEILLVKFEDYYEIVMAIFDDYSNNGCAKIALFVFLKDYGKSIDKPLQAVVQKDNPNLDKIEKILKDYDFELILITEEGNFIYELVKK